MAISLLQVGQKTYVLSDGNGFNCFNLADEFKFHGYNLARIRKQDKLTELQLKQGLRLCHTPIYGAIIPQIETLVKFERAVFRCAISRGASLMSWARNGLALALLPHEDTTLQRLQSADAPQ